MEEPGRVMEGEPGLAVEATEMEELGLAVEPAGAPAEPPVRLEIPVEAGGTRTRGKTTGERERITGEAGGAKEDRGRMELLRSDKLRVSLVICIVMHLRWELQAPAI